MSVVSQFTSNTKFSSTNPCFVLLSGENLLAPFHVSLGFVNENLSNSEGTFSTFSTQCKQLPLEKLTQPTGPITIMKVSKSLFLVPTNSKTPWLEDYYLFKPLLPLTILYFFLFRSFKKRKKQYLKMTNVDNYDCMLNLTVSFSHVISCHFPHNL